MIRDKKVFSLEFLWLGLYAFAGFSLELILSLVTNGLGLAPLSVSVNALLTACLWFGSVWLLINYSKKIVGFDPLANRQTVEKRALCVSLFLCLMIIIVSTIGFGGFKPLVEFNGSLNRSIIALFARTLYYFAETALIVLTIIFGQEFCERQFSINTNIPGGGFFLALTWGLMHFLLQGAAGGFYTMFFSIVSGIIFILFRKNPFITYLVISVAFIL